MTHRLIISGLFATLWAAPVQSGVFPEAVCLTGPIGFINQPTSPKDSSAKIVSISGTLNGWLRWMQNHHIADIRSQSASDLFIRKFEIGLHSNFDAGISATAVLNSEWVGDYENLGDGKIALDEVHLDLRIPGSPFYLVFGQRTQPFGIFENHLITEPMTQDAYETKKVGLSAGCAGPWNSDVSMTIYKGREHINHLLAAQLIDTTSLVANSEEHDDLSSYIVAATVSPQNGNITAFGSIIGEPGAGAYNTSLNLGCNLSFPFLKNLVYDVEWIKALSREKLNTEHRTFKESVLSMSATYQFILRTSRLKSRGLYEGRLEYRETHPMQIGFRYEYLDDDGLAQALIGWSVKDKFSLGGEYSFYEVKKLIAYVAAELRHSRYRVHSSLYPLMHHKNVELFVKLGIDF